MGGGRRSQDTLFSFNRLAKFKFPHSKISLDSAILTFSEELSGLQVSFLREGFNFLAGMARSR